MKLNPRCREPFLIKVKYAACWEAWYKADVSGRRSLSVITMNEVH
jgi:hypothetical protein